MQREFLEGLGIGQEALEAILEAHGTELRQLQLDAAVQSAVMKAKGRNVKAISALLDMQAIAASEDMAGALDTALEALKKENGYLFETQTPPPYASRTGAADTAAAQQPATLAGALREKLGKH